MKKSTVQPEIAAIVNKAIAQVNTTMKYVVMDTSTKVDIKTRINKEGMAGIVLTTGETFVRPGSPKFNQVMSDMKAIKAALTPLVTSIDHIGADASCDKVRIVITL